MLNKHRTGNFFVPVESLVLKGGKNRLDRDWSESTMYALWKDYVKTLFALLYRYDVLMCACGENPD